MEEEAVAAGLAGRLFRRRAELGIDLEEVARRSRLGVDYLERLERVQRVAPSDDVILHLAKALETTPVSLTGAEVAGSAGRGRVGLRPAIRSLPRMDCEARLRGGGIGRVVFVSGGVPIALPVNFRFHHCEVVFRTAAGAGILRCLGSQVSFEVDRLDENTSEGWSVLVTGRAEQVEANECAPYVRLGIEPWAGGFRDVFVRIIATAISGRAIGQLAP